MAIKKAAAALDERDTESQVRRWAVQAAIFALTPPAWLGALGRPGRKRVKVSGIEPAEIGRALEFMGFHLINSK